MEPKKSKYDTNPLDPDFVKNAQEEWTGDESRGETSEVGDRATREIRGAASEEARGSVYSEAPTRSFDNVQVNAPYPSVYGHQRIRHLHRINHRLHHLKPLPTDPRHAPFPA